MRLKRNAIGLHSISALVFFTDFFFDSACHASVNQFLNDSFYQNPAALSLIDTAQITTGSVFLNPKFQFNGLSYNVTGVANSNVFDYLPYLLSSYRLSEKLVTGFNITPSAYGHLDWSDSPFVAQASTVTNVRYYRYGFQSSYQYSDRLALGLGLNVEQAQVFDLNFFVSGAGNQLNSVRGVNFTGDLGLYYRLDPKSYLTIAGYTQVNTYGHGVSISRESFNNNLSLNITEAPVIYVGLEHFENKKWLLALKIYWSGWSIQKNINFTNTTTGTYVVPTNWKDVWSFQVNSSYAIIESLAFISSIIYESNPVLLQTNAIGYPLAASGAVSGGLDIALRKNLSIQATYSYGAFLPNSPINNATSVGTINANFQAVVIQFIYKI